MVEVNKLLENYRKIKAPKSPKKLIFTGIEDFDAYNITAPFTINNKLFMVARVEKRDSEHSQIMFFNKTALENEISETWSLNNNIAPLKLQDPFFTFINNEIILGGVEIEENIDNTLTWRTAFYRGKNLGCLEKFFTGPNGMKDIRLCELKDKRIALFTRPQGEIGGRGKIGFNIISNIDELSIDLINKTPILEMFKDDEWGGVNEVHVIDENRLGVLGHIACFSNNNIRHYYPMFFKLNLSDLSFTMPKIICERKDFLDGSSKRDDLIDVVFAGGIVLNNTLATLYAGTSDCEAQKIIIPNPFI